MKEQALINSTMCSRFKLLFCTKCDANARYHELCVGRWVWKGGITRAGGIVPWTAQATNTDPSNFLWSTDKIYVEVISPGLYCSPAPDLLPLISSALCSQSFLLFRIFRAVLCVALWAHFLSNILLTFSPLVTRSALDFTPDLSHQSRSDFLAHDRT